MKKLAVCLCILLFTLGCTKVDLSGIWRGKMIAASGKSINVEALLKQNGKDISGNLTIRDVGGQLKLTGSLNGNKLIFNTDINDGLYISFVGTIENEMIKGNADVTMHGSNIPGGKATEAMKIELSRL